MVIETYNVPVHAKKCHRYVLVSVRQCLHIVSCLSIVFSPFSFCGTTKPKCFRNSDSKLHVFEGAFCARVFTSQMLCSVSKAVGYRSVKSLVTSHLYYLVDEWLKQRKSDDRYTLGSFPYCLLDHETVKDFYK